MNFDSTYYTTEVNGTMDHPHFAQRADWIKSYITGDNPKIYILGCGFGHLVKHLRLLGINAYGVELSYAYSQRVIDEVFNVDIKDADMSDADYIFSWNVLDCLNDNNVEAVLENLNLFSCPQAHVVCTTDDYEGYFIKSVAYWHNVLPNAHIISYEDKSGLEGMPLSWGLVAE